MTTDKRLPFERFLDFADDVLQHEVGTAAARAAWRHSLAQSLQTTVDEWFEDHPRTDDWRTRRDEDPPEGI